MKKSEKQLGKVFKTLVVSEYAGATEDHTSLWRCKCNRCSHEDVYDLQTLRRHKIATACTLCKSREKGFCSKGHPIAEWGRTSGGTCRACLRERNLLREYGITMQEYEDIWRAQGGKCAICGRAISILAPGMPGWHEGSRIEVDHKHGTNLPKRETVRGLLCGGRWAGCNRKLGRLDKPEWLAAALTYVTEPPARKVLRKLST